MHATHVPDDGSTILVVDNEPRIVELVSAMLRMAGYRVMQAISGAQALRIVNWARIDLVVTDVNMPDVDGLHLATHLRRAAPGLPILFLSGSVNNTSPLGVLKKPFHMADLHTRVAEALRLHVRWGGSQITPSNRAH